MDWMGIVMAARFGAEAGAVDTGTRGCDGVRAGWAKSGAGAGAAATGCRGVG